MGEVIVLITITPVINDTAITDIATTIDISVVAVGLRDGPMHVYHS